MNPAVSVVYTYVWTPPLNANPTKWTQILHTSDTHPTQIPRKSRGHDTITLPRLTRKPNMNLQKVLLTTRPRLIQAGSSQSKSFSYQRRREGERERVRERVRERERKRERVRE